MNAGLRARWGGPPLERTACSAQEVCEAGSGGVGYMHPTLPQGSSQWEAVGQ
jgi:hypothetical protein